MEERILNYFFENPKDVLNLRTLSKKTGISHMSVLRTVRNLSSKGYLRLEKKKVESLVSLDYDSTKDARRLYNLKKVLESGLADYLEKFFEFPDAIVLFGSYSFGEDEGTGDIDIAVQTTLERRPELKNLEKKLNRPIELFLFDDNTKEELKKSIYNGFVLRGRIR